MDCQCRFHFLYSGFPQYIRDFRHIYSDLDRRQEQNRQKPQHCLAVNILFLEELQPGIFRIWGIARNSASTS